MKNKRVVEYIERNKGQIIAFLLTFGLCLWMLLPQEDMLFGITDVTDIWKTISTYNTSAIEGSYVLYKGFLAVLPYVWLREMSLFIGMGEWFLLKVFHAFLFSSVVAVGIPYIISHIFKINIRPYRRIIFCILGFYLWKSTYIVRAIMIDLPAMYFFVFSVCASIKIAKEYKNINKLYFLYAGVLFGCASSYTGQYAPAVVLLIMFVLIAMFYKKKRENKGKIVPIILSLLLLSCGFFVPKACNLYFDNTLVRQLKENGAGILDADDWTQIAIGQAKRRYTMFWGPTIINQRSLSIIMADKGESYEEFMEQMDGNNAIYTIKEVIGLVLKHPVDFITSWCNGFLLTVSMNGNANRTSFLFLSYTTLFISLYVLFKHWGTLKGVFVKETLLIIAFVLPALVTCATHYEPRYVVAFQALFLGTAIYTDVLWNVFGDLFIILKACKEQKSICPIKEKFNAARFPYVLVLYCVFVVMCFSNYAAIYETSGADPTLLFQW